MNKNISFLDENIDYYSHERLEEKLNELKDFINEEDNEEDYDYNPIITANIIKKYNENYENIISPTDSLNFKNSEYSSDLSSTGSIDLGDSPLSPNPVEEYEIIDNKPIAELNLIDNQNIDLVYRPLIKQNVNSISLEKKYSSPEKTEIIIENNIKPQLVKEIQPITVIDSIPKQSPIKPISPKPPPSELPFTSSKISV